MRIDGETDAALKARLDAMARMAMEERFKRRLATADQRNGYEVGYYEALLEINGLKRDDA